MDIFSTLVSGVKSLFGGKDSYAISSSYDFTWSEEKALDYTEKYYELIPKISAISKSISEISKTISALPYEIVNKETKEVIENTPEEVTELLKQPTPTENYSEYITLLITDLLIAGNIFVYLLNEDNKPWIPRLDPSFITATLKTSNERQFISYPVYTFNSLQGYGVPLKSQFLIHQKLFPNPKNKALGRGIIATNLTLTNNLYNLLKFWAAFQKNGMNLSGMFFIKNVKAKADLQRVKSEILEQYQGVANSGKAGVLSGEVDFKQTGVDASQMKILENIQLLSKELRDAFGLPNYKQEMGLRSTGQKWNNFELQQEDWLKNTIRPLTLKLESLFNNVIQRVNKNWEFRYKLALEVYKPETIKIMVGDGIITPNQGRRLMNLEELDDPDMDIIYCAAGRTTLNRVAEGTGELESEPETEQEVEEEKPKKGAEEEKKPEESEEESKEEKKFILNGKIRTKSWREYLSEPENDTWTVQEIKAARNKRRIAQDFKNINSKTVEKQVKEHEKTFKEYLVNSYVTIFKNWDRTQKDYDQLIASTKAVKPLDKYIESLYSQSVDATTLMERGEVIYESIGQASYGNTEAILTVQVPFIIKDPGVAKHIAQLKDKLTLVTKTTQDKIERVVKRGVEEGKTSGEIGKNLWKTFVDDKDELSTSFTKSTVSGRILNDRASTIARTEVANANRLFTAQSMKDSEVVKTIELQGYPDACSICASHFHKQYSFDRAEELSSLHPQCKCSIVPGTFVD